MTILVTGAAGFIGSSLIVRLLNEGRSVVGIDNHNDYYDPKLKEARISRYINNSKYTHERADLVDRDHLFVLFTKYKPKIIINLAAQAGVRYSIENPFAYVDSNIVGFVNILEVSRIFEIDHFVYASSSSVYGSNQKLPFSVSDGVDHPLNMYAATKRANELIAHSYSHVYAMPTTGLRFFTVYGPWGRPDMALFIFTKNILAGEPIKVFNFGNHKRDFTYIDDIVDGLLKVMESPPTCNEGLVADRNLTPAKSKDPWRIYNIGNSRSVPLLEYIKAIESAVGKRAILDMQPMQIGDVVETLADVQDLYDQFGYRPNTLIVEGINKFVAWYREYHGV
jgi:UDP-glucuronate 4-epimerase